MYMLLVAAAPSFAPRLAGGRRHHDCARPRLVRCERGPTSSSLSAWPPPFEPWDQAVFLVRQPLLYRDLRLPHQARHVRDARMSPARARAHEALLRSAVHANVARLAIGVLRARLDGGRRGFLVLLSRFGAARCRHSSRARCQRKTWVRRGRMWVETGDRRPSARQHPAAFRWSPRSALLPDSSNSAP